MDTILKYFEPDQKIVELLTQGMDCHPLLATLLSARGISTVEDAIFFLNPSLQNLTDPFALKDLDKAVKRIFTAVENKEKILIFGDFDADGVTSTALLSDFLEYCGANVSWYIPHRIKEGYSLAPDHIQMASDQDIDLIITVDCGVSSHKAVKNANLEDIDVIITDHHEPSSTLPSAMAVVDPKREDCPSGLNFLAGVGVAFFLVMGLRKFFREKGFWEDIKEPNLIDYLDLFAIGTIGDMVPLIKENRVLCIAGLKKIRQGTRLGLRSLAQICRIDSKKIDSDDISFKIVPRINAAGRISHARICVTQLTTPDIVNADKTASILDQLNKKRQIIEQEITFDIERRLLKYPNLLDNKLLFLWDDEWNPSVLGIAASKLSRKYSCPVILLSSAGDHAIGSGRSINNINILQALIESETLLEKFGGHAMACGLTVSKDNLQTLYQSLNRYMEKIYLEIDFQKTLAIDAILDLEDINYNLAKEIDRLRPFGMANPEPIFICENIRVASSHVIGNSHRKMVLAKADSVSRHQVEAFHFNISDPNDLPDYYSKIAFRLKINKFKKTSAQIIIENF
ncbi:MAG: single-stranded-DNA-specific exonuclease RecJ [Desulfobacula sp.]|uniref:single-stranded-DNA-specific exonuclease RecJ n=1 Tax=Desulfobacula sp. TaxID=2593537 RepID=UPI0025BBB507|nr:single-stranded-DNA-specific exonuclease RecJ [Desulfobacula sp.]MCD4718933.1 single-stranded-DNA-specific exonuclease RecJ [Desulfobacula sp.]